MLLEARRRGERLAAVGAGVGPSPDVLRADVPLQVAGVREHLLRCVWGGQDGASTHAHTHKGKRDRRGGFNSMEEGGGGGEAGGGRGLAVPLSSSHTRSACRCHVTSGGESGWTSS